MYSAPKVLNDEDWWYRGRDGELRAWGAEEVRRTLDNYWIYAGYVGVGRGPKRELRKGSHAPILPDAITALVAARFRKHPNGWNKRKPFIYSLSGLLYCACGERLRGTANYKTRIYRHMMKCT